MKESSATEDDTGMISNRRCSICSLSWLNFLSNCRRRYKINCLPIIVTIVIFLSNVIASADGFCPPKCTCNDETVECTDTNLELIPFLLDPNIKALNLSSNKITSISQSLSFYPDVRALDLSHNEISAIEMEDLEAQTKIKVLILSDNKLVTVKNETLSSMKNLNELYLDNNLISSLESLSLDGLTGLKILKLSKNNLRSLSDMTFLSTTNLEKIELNYNNFQSIPSNAIKGLSNLKEINLDGNYVSRLNPLSFKSLRYLLSLTLNKNNISVIHPKSFNGLRNLVSLSIKDNRLRTVPGQSLAPLVKLERLDLSGNLFLVLNSESFRKAPSTLRHLYLTRCPHLTSIESQTFHTMGNLEKLDLSHNARLGQLGGTIFAPLTNLRDIDLTACGIMYIIPKQMPQGLRTQLHLAGNPLHCNCSLLWLANLPSNSTNDLDSPRCATPSSLYGFKVSDVDPRTAGCDHQLSLMAIAVCIGVVILGFLIIGVFLACRWKKSSSFVTKDSNIRYPHPGESTLRELYRDPTSELVPIPTPIFAPKYSIPQHTPQVSFPHCVPDNRQQCTPGCQILRSQGPYAVHPATHPLLTPTSPSPTNQGGGQLPPVEWLCQSPYEDDTLHWYTTIGRDGREYLTGIAGELTFIPPPPPVTLPPELPPSPPISVRLQRKPSSVSQPSPRVSSKKRFNVKDSPEKTQGNNTASPEKSLNNTIITVPHKLGRMPKDTTCSAPVRVPTEPMTYI